MVSIWCHYLSGCLVPCFFWGVSVQGSLCLGGGGLCQGEGVSVKGSLSRGLYEKGVSVQGVLCKEIPLNSYWNAFLFSKYFTENCRKMKEFGPRVGRASMASPGSATDHNHHHTCKQLYFHHHHRLLSSILTSSATTTTSTTAGEAAAICSHICRQLFNANATTNTN